MSWTYDDTALQLWKAVQSGEATHIQQLINENVDLNITDRNSNTFLHTAAKYRKDDVVKELIEAGVDVNAQNNNGQTALHLAADRGHAYTVLLLLENGCLCDTKTKFSEMTALHLAARFGHHEVVRLLVDSGADVNMPDSIGKSPDFYSATDEVRKLFHELKDRSDLGLNKSQHHTGKTDDHHHPNGMNDMATTNQKTGQSLNPPDAQKISILINNSKKSTAIHRSVNHKLEFSENHQKRMRKNVFDRLASNKKK